MPRYIWILMLLIVDPAGMEDISHDSVSFRLVLLSRWMEECEIGMDTLGITFHLP
jgi:hypothetical protein